MNKVNIVEEEKHGPNGKPVKVQDPSLCGAITNRNEARGGM